PQPHTARLVHALRRRRHRRPLRRPVGPRELTPTGQVVSGGASGSGPGSPRRDRVRTISTSASAARKTIAIQPSVRTFQKNVGHSKRARTWEEGWVAAKKAPQS